jgi:hypothetical protein
MPVDSIEDGELAQQFVTYQLESERKEFERKAEQIQRVFSKAEDEELKIPDLVRLVENLWSHSSNDSDRIAKQMNERTQRSVTDIFFEIKHSDNIAQKYNLLQDVQQIGTASASEILATLDPETCAITNSRAREALEKLDSDLKNSEPNDGESYRTYCEELESIREDLNTQLRDTDAELQDLIDLHLFFNYFVMDAGERSRPDGSSHQSVSIKTRIDRFFQWRRPLRRLRDQTESFETRIDRFFQWLWPLHRLRDFGVPLLISGIILAFTAELVICATAVFDLTYPYFGGCRHILTIQLIEGATSLAFSLTAFLLVGTVVLAADQIRESEVDSSDGGRGDGWQLRIKPDNNVSRDRPRIQVIDLIEFKNYKRIDSGVGPDWYIMDSDLENRTLIVAQDTIQSDLSIPEGTYRVDITDTGSSESHSWLAYLESDVDFSEYNLGVLERAFTESTLGWAIRPESETDDDGDLDGTVQEYRRQVQRALSYGVSASILGILIQAYPFGAPESIGVWLSNLESFEHIGYFISSYIFILMFSGMIWTSIGLVELLSNLSSSS